MRQLYVSPRPELGRGGLTGKNESEEKRELIFKEDGQGGARA